MIYQLVANKYATLKELKEDYDVEDTLDLYETFMVNLYNKHQVMRSKNG